MKEAFEKIIERLEEKRDKYENLASSSNFDGYHEEEIKYLAMQEAYEEAIEIVNKVAEEYVPDINVGEIEEFCEWGFAGDFGEWYACCKPLRVYIPYGVHSFKYCPYCGKEIKVVE